MFLRLKHDIDISHYINGSFFPFYHLVNVTYLGLQILLTTLLNSQKLHTSESFMYNPVQDGHMLSPSCKTAM